MPLLCNCLSSTAPGYDMQLPFVSSFWVHQAFCCNERKENEGKTCWLRNSCMYSLLIGMSACKTPRESSEGATKRFHKLCIIIMFNSSCCTNIGCCHVYALTYLTCWSGLEQAAHYQSEYSSCYQVGTASKMPWLIALNSWCPASY